VDIIEKLPKKERVRIKSRKVIPALLLHARKQGLPLHDRNTFLTVKTGGSDHSWPLSGRTHRTA
jgi:hypothetical protein